MDWSFTRIFPSVITIISYFGMLVGLIYNFLVARRIETNHLKHLQEDVTALTSEVDNVKTEIAEVKAQVAGLDGYIRGKLGK